MNTRVAITVVFVLLLPLLCPAQDMKLPVPGRPQGSSRHFLPNPGRARRHLLQLAVGV